MSTSKAVHILRWLGVLPAAVLAFLISQAVVIFGWMLMGVVQLNYLPPDVMELLGLLMNMFLGPWAFVAAGGLTAPSRKLVAAAILAVLFTGLSCVSTAASYLLVVESVGSTEALMGLVVGVVGSLFGCVTVFRACQLQ